MSDTEWGEDERDRVRREETADRLARRRHTRADDEMPTRAADRRRAWVEEDAARDRAYARYHRRLNRADAMEERERRRAPSTHLARRAHRDFQDTEADVARRGLERRVREGQEPVQGGEHVDMGRWIPHPSRSSYGPPNVHPDDYHPQRQVVAEGARGEREARDRGGVYPRQFMNTSAPRPPRGERVVGRQPREFDMQPVRVGTEGPRAAESRRIREDKRRRARRQGRARGLVRALRRGR